jgi:hypothetical protein
MCLTANTFWITEKNPGLVYSFADDLNHDVKMANQIGWAFKGRGKKATEHVDKD